MSAAQRAAVEKMLRDGPLDLAAPVAEQRATFDDMFGSVQLSGDVETAWTRYGDVPVAAFIPSGANSPGSILYVHGGAFAVGNAEGSLPLATDLARRAGLSGGSVDYRLAPENPFPAALDDVVAAYRSLIATTDPSSVVLVGESAGGNLVLSALLRLRDEAVPLPAAAAVFSPVTDVTLSGGSMRTKAEVDPVITEAGLRLRIEDYAHSSDLRTPYLSPVFGELDGLPPLLIQAGGNEVLLDDAVRFAAAAAHAGVVTRLDVVPGVPHVFQGFAAMLDEGAAALDRAAQFLLEQLDPRNAEG